MLTSLASPASDRRLTSPESDRAPASPSRSISAKRDDTHGVIAVWVQPRVASHVSAVQASSSSQSTGVLMQPPPGAQLSCVHGLLSLQLVPAVVQQVLRLHVRPVEQTTAVPLPLVGQLAVVPLHALPSVQTLPSSQYAPATA